jgi:hypothetical protein
MEHIEINLRARKFSTANNNIHRFSNHIEKIYILKQHIILFIYPLHDDPNNQNYEKLVDSNNIYCFDFEGNLVWQGGRFDGNLPDWLYEESLPFSGKYPHYMSIDGDLIVLTYGIGLGCYRWLNPVTGEVVKEEWDKYGR